MNCTSMPGNVAFAEPFVSSAIGPTCIALDVHPGPLFDEGPVSEIPNRKTAVTFYSKHTQSWDCGSGRDIRVAGSGGTLFYIPLYKPILLTRHYAAPRNGTSLIQSLGYSLDIPKG